MNEMSVIGGRGVATGIESAASMLAAQAKAAVEARYIMAMRDPRSIEAARMEILKECSRPSFAANKSTLYAKPVGGGAPIVGLGIRFVEMAMRCMRHTMTETPLVFENDEVEVYRVTVTDIQSNVTFQQEVRVSKTVERSRPMDDGTFFSVRKNSRGQPVYTVRATEDDMLNKRLSHISKAIRTQGLRLIPGDILDDAIETIKAIRADKAAKDPDADRREVLAIFSSVGVTAKMVEEYLGRKIEQCDIDTVSSLRALAGAIYDGEATWAQAMGDRAQAKQPEAAPAKMTDEQQALLDHIGELLAKTTSDAEALNFWVAERDNFPKNSPAYNAFKDAVVRRREEIAKQATAPEGGEQ